MPFLRLSPFLLTIVHTKRIEACCSQSSYLPPTCKPLLVDQQFVERLLVFLAQREVISFFCRLIRSTLSIFSYGSARTRPRFFSTAPLSSAFALSSFPLFFLRRNKTLLILYDNLHYLGKALISRQWFG